MKDCYNCQHCAMDMDMDPFCGHPTVLKTNPYGSNTNVVRGAALGDERTRLPHFNICGQEARLFEKRRVARGGKPQSMVPAVQPRVPRR